METQLEGPWTQKLEGVLHVYLNKIWDWEFFEMRQQNTDRSSVNVCTGPVFYHQRVLSTSARRTRVLVLSLLPVDDAIPLPLLSSFSVVVTQAQMWVVLYHVILLINAFPFLLSPVFQ